MKSPVRKRSRVVAVKARYCSVRTPSPTRWVRRLKLLTAVLSVLALGVGLLTFGVLVTKNSARFERQRVDQLLERHVTTTAGSVNFADDEAIVIDPDRRVLVAGGYPQVYVVDTVAAPTEIHVALSPSEPTWPDVDVIDVALQAREEREPVVATTTALRAGSETIERLRLWAAPVHDPDNPDDRAGAVVVGVANLAPGEASHGRLVELMWWSGALMLGLYLLIAVLLSRGKWWVADKVLVRHEQFLRDTAHELRGPLASLQAISEAGLGGAEPPQRALERVAVLAHDTNEVIEDLLTLARMETDREPLRAGPVRLDALVESLVEVRTDDPPVRLRTSTTVVVANAELVRRAVGNLVDNAVHHGRADDLSTEVMVTVEDGRVEVADRGPGIHPQLLTHLVERMGDRQQPNGHLGLALTVWVARVHGGDLRATNRPGGGALFTLELPRAD